MFINCRHCNALVATDPVTDLPPERCPRCKGMVREPAADAAVADTADAPQTPPAPVPVAPPPTPDPDPPPVAAPMAEVPEPAAAAATGIAVTATPPAPAAAETETSPVAASAADALPSPVAEEGLPSEADATADAMTATAAAPERDTDATPPSPATLDTVEASAETDAPQVDEPPAADADTPDAATPGASTAADAAGSEATPAAATATSPGFLSRAASVPAPARGWRRWGPAVVIVALVVLLGLQVVIADRERLAADAQWRPLAASVCGLFGCRLPAWREPDAFVLLAREVRPHPGVDGALRVRASFRNDARWAQAMPRLLLTLSDVDGRAVAARTFNSDEYLASSEAAALIEAGQTADVALDILEPSMATVSYTFDFL